MNDYDGKADADHGDCCMDVAMYRIVIKGLQLENAKLHAEVERLRDERRWRDADKEWPAGTEWCLCRWREPTELMCLRFNGHGEWTDFDGDVQYPMWWQPLPAPPVKEE